MFYTSKLITLSVTHYESEATSTVIAHVVIPV
jgi:hypothetical protein